MWTFLLAVLLACSDDPSPEPAPPLATLSADEAARLVQATDDPIERILLAERIIEAQPQRAADLCPHLPAGDAQRRCQAVAARPHLWTETTQPLPDPRPAPPSAEVAALPSPECPDSRLDCVQARADEAALAGRLNEAVGRCRGLGEARWQQECAFRAAERLADRRGPEGYADSATLCAAAGSFEADCFSHLFGALTRTGPPAATPGWGVPRRNAAVLRAYWQERDPAFLRAALDRYWSDVLARAYGTTGQVTGDPLDAIPPQAAAHARSYAALRLMQLTPDTAEDLAGWVAALGAALERRAISPTPPSPRPSIQVAPDLWGVADAPDRPSIIYLSTSRRAVSEDPQVDAVLAVLEAAARQSPPRRPLLQEGQDHPAEVVRWTADRLLAALRPRPGFEDEGG